MFPGLGENKKKTNPGINFTEFKIFAVSKTSGYGCISYMYFLRVNHKNNA